MKNKLAGLAVVATLVIGIGFFAISNIAHAASTSTLNVMVGIDSGAAATASANVTLSLTAVAGMNQMWVSNDSTFATSTGTGWVPFQATYPWTLTSGTGNKTVNAEFRNASTTAVAGTAEASINLVQGETQPQTQGVVLGATAYNFTFNLKLGMNGEAVTELQKRLTSEGVYSSPITGYFGQLTLAAVKLYQTKHNIVPASGFVGSLTRAQLNSSLVLGASVVNAAALNAEITTLQEQMLTLLQQLSQILQARTK
jgi:hypothetical protein